MATGLADQLAHLDMADILGLLSQERDRSDLLAVLARDSNLSQDVHCSIPFIEVVLDWVLPEAGIATGL